MNPITNLICPRLEVETCSLGFIFTLLIGFALSENPTIVSEWPIKETTT